MTDFLQTKMLEISKFTKIILLLLVSLTVSQTIQAETKQLYFENLNTTPGLTRSIPVASAVTLTQGSAINLDLTPTFAAPFTITGATTIDIILVVQRIGGPAVNSVSIDLYNSNDLVTPIGSDAGTWNNGGPATLKFSIPVISDENFAIGDFVRLVITNTSATNNSFRVRSTNSQIQMQTTTVISIDAADVYANPYPDTTAYSSYTAGTTVYLRATVSDPFGFLDISSVDFSVDDPNSPPSVFTANIITPEPGASGATAVFETPYTIPAVPAPDGTWTINFIAHEGTEGTVTDAVSTNFNVGTPIINVRKTSSTTYDPVNVDSYKAIPGSRVEYSVEIINSGFGFVDDSTTIITDPLPPGTTFYFGDPGPSFPDPVQFVQGPVSSGLSFTFGSLSDSTDDIDFSTDGCLSYLLGGPAADPVTGYDITSPKVNCIRLNPKGEFNGSDGVNNPSVVIKFKVKVD